MKNIIIAIIIISAGALIGFSVISKQNISKPKPELKADSSASNRQENLRQATLKIDGMFCVSCATGAEYALKEKEGVVDAGVDYDSKSGRVVYDPSKISKDELIGAVKPYTAVITEDAPFK